MSVIGIKADGIAVFKQLERSYLHNFPPQGSASQFLPYLRHGSGGARLRGGSRSFLPRIVLSQQRNRSAPSGFSLVELLVVVAILAILASLALPALARSRLAAGGSRCTSNLRQFALGAQMYWEDHGGKSFRYLAVSGRGGDEYWFGWISRGTEGTRSYDSSKSPLAAYIGMGGIRLCPLQTSGPDFKPKAIGRTCDYGYNRQLASEDGNDFRVSTINAPCRVVSFADAAQINTFQYPATPEKPLLEEFYYVSESEPTTHYRHAGRSLAAHVDGHVESVAGVPKKMDRRMPQHRVGVMDAYRIIP